jgi:transcriptional antiterminator RfaH
LPKEQVWTVRLGRRIKQTVMLFPRYLFVAFPLDGRWMSLRSTKGVANVVMTGELPSRMPEAAMQSLIERTGKDGIIELDEQATRFSKGQNIQLVAGPFKGIRGLYQGQSKTEREKVLLDILGKQVTVEVGANDLAAA